MLSTVLTMPSGAYVIQVQALIETIEPQAALADKTYDADALLDCLDAMQARSSFPRNATLGISDACCLEECPRTKPSGGR